MMRIEPATLGKLVASWKIKMPMSEVRTMLAPAKVGKLTFSGMRSSALAKQKALTPPQAKAVAKRRLFFVLLKCAKLESFRKLLCKTLKTIESRRNIRLQ
jgi:hypothetical protein